MLQFVLRNRCFALIKIGDFFFLNAGQNFKGPGTKICMQEIGDIMGRMAVHDSLS